MSKKHLSNGVDDGPGHLRHGADDGPNHIHGDDGPNHLRGRGGDDVLKGRGGDDDLNGGLGDDTLVGGLGEDHLHGGRGNDLFRFNSIDDSPDGVGHDVIDDFHRGDKIHLSHIDADPASPGNQRFHWIGEDNFHNQAGELHFVRQGADVLLQGDVDGDGAADFEVLVQNLSALHRHDIIL